MIIVTKKNKVAQQNRGKEKQQKRRGRTASERKVKYEKAKMEEWVEGGTKRDGGEQVERRNTSIMKQDRSGRRESIEEARRKEDRGKQDTDNIKA